MAYSRIDGKVVIVTGCNTGIGYSIARELYKLGGVVVMACRTPEKAESAKAQILTEVEKMRQDSHSSGDAADADDPNDRDASDSKKDKRSNIEMHSSSRGDESCGRLDVMELDVASFSSIRAFVTHFQSRYQALHCLINNAGVMQLWPRQTTADGLECQIGTNYIGPWLLTGLLLPRLLISKEGRVVNQSSQAAYYGAISWDDFQSEKNYNRITAYAQSKLAQVMHSVELQSRINAAGLDLLSLSAEPGIAMTQLQENSLAQGKSWWEPVVYFVTKPLQQDVEGGARSALYAALSYEAQPGAFYGPTGLLLKGPPGKSKLPRLAQDENARRKLWEETERITGFRYSLTPEGSNENSPADPRL